MSPRASRFLKLLQDKQARRSALLVALWLPAVVVLYAVREVLLPFTLALLLAYVIAPLVKRISSVQVSGKNIPRWGSVLILYGALALVLTAFGLVFVPQVSREVARAAKEGTELLNQIDEQKIAEIGQRVEAWFNKYDVPVRIVTPGDRVDGADPIAATHGLTVDVVQITQDLVRQAKGAVFEESKKVFGQVQALVAWVLRVVAQTFLVFMLTGFLAADTERIFGFLFSITPVRDRSTVSDMLGRIDRGLSGVVRGQLTICVINGALTLLGLLLLKVKFAFLMATVAAVFSLVPIFGSILSTIPIVLVALSGGVTTALLAVLWIVGIHALEANFLNPKIMGDAAKIHPALVVLALIIGEHYYGLIGALLAVPIMSIVATIFKAARQKAMQLDAEISSSVTDETRPAPASMRRVRMQDGG